MVETVTFLLERLRPEIPYLSGARNIVLSAFGRSIGYGNPQVSHKTSTASALGNPLILNDCPEESVVDLISPVFYNPEALQISISGETLSGRARRKYEGNLLLFPTQEDTGSAGVGDIGMHPVEGIKEEYRSPHGTRLSPIGGIDELDVVICGTFRKDNKGLRNSFEQLKDLGFNILSPSNVDITTEDSGFVYMRGEETETPENLELRHLEAIQRARLIWLHAPDGYVGPTAALELGFAKASGIPVFSSADLSDVALRAFVTVVSSPKDVLQQIESYKMPPPPPALKPFQNYYRRAAAQRGYERESTQNCLLLMVEEVGELARALRKRESLTRHGPAIRNAEALELADVFMYVIHMANILRIDLGQVVQQKELLNIEKLLQKS